MGLFQGIVDFYDYNYPYYRWYVHRRVIFRDDTVNNDKPRESLFANKDNENFGLILKHSVRIMLFTGGIFALADIASMFKPSRPLKEMYARGGVILLFSGVVGALYATVLYSVANWRETSGPVNHMIAGAGSMPLFAVLSKSNRLTHAAILAVYPGLLAAGIKLHADGSLDMGGYQPSRFFNITQNEIRRNEVIRPFHGPEEVVYGECKKAYGKH